MAEIVTKESLRRQTFGSEATSKSAECCKLLSSFRVQSVEVGQEFKMQHLMNWIAANGSVLAVMVTVGVAVLLVSCLECSHCGSREKDEFFKRHEV